MLTVERVRSSAGPGVSIQRGQFRRDTTAKLIAIEPVAARGGASSSESPKRKRRRLSVRAVRRSDAGASGSASLASATTVSHDTSVRHSAA
ncbi:hypothetical protein WI26_21855 [Burkholderia diffusa]|nr:hypothetical protein WI26_21855 [Burkholderia diffusa]